MEANGTPPRPEWESETGKDEEVFGDPIPRASDETAPSSLPVVSDDEPILGDHNSFPFPIVGIGGSAGGVHATTELFKHLPPDTGMAFVVIQHLQAEQKSYLPHIISHHTAMPALVIEDGMRPEPNRIYFLPPNASVTLQDKGFRLEGRLLDGIPHPIDYFFESLAAVQGCFAIGIVLSGMDGDGSLGLNAIRGSGGISIVQAPESARFPEMPRSSISGDHVDLIAAPEKMGRHLVELAEQSRVPGVRRLEAGDTDPSDEKNFARIIRQLRTVSGVDFRLYKPSTLRRRIARRLLMRKIDTLAEYIQFLQANPKEVQDLQEDALINVTRFFRDREVFESLKHNIIPQILERQNSDQQVRVWVTGCSSGEEVYSIAMCFLECLTGQPNEPAIQLFGTDASQVSIQKARLAIYPETIAGEVSPERLRRFFVKTEKGYQVAKRIRDMCIFARQNLCNDPPFSRLDLVSCRNVLIYFGAQLQRQLLPTFHYALRPDGFLLLGSSETIREFTDLFSLADRKNKIYSRIGSTPTRAVMDLIPHLFVPDFNHDEGHGAQDGIPTDFELQRTADRLILARYGPPGVVLNEKGEILHTRGQTGDYLTLAPGAATLQLARMVREDIASQVISAISRAVENDMPVQVERLRTREDSPRGVTLEVLPMQPPGSHPKHYLVLFVPVSNSAVVEPEIASWPEEDRDRVIAQQQRDLSSTRMYLQTLLQERDAKNQELISANEEIQSANEELQSTNEELETTKEELQSSNEELQTVNDELQNRNSVLTQASNDLSNLLNSVNLPVVMLDIDFTIRHFTPQAQRLINVRATDVGRPFSDIRLNLDIDNLQPVLTDVLETLAPRELEARDTDGRWYLVRVRPYRTTDNKIDGLVVVLVDIDQLRRSQQEFRDARDFADAIIEETPFPLAVVDSEFRIQSTNDAFCSLVGSTSQALKQRLLPDLGAVLWNMERPLRSLLENLRSAAGTSGNFQFEHKTSDELSRIFQVRGRVLQPRGEKFLLVTFEDITAHREMERILKSEGARLANQVELTTKELERSRAELRALTGNLMMSQEEERRRLARELHDDVSQRLAALNMAGDDILRRLQHDPETARQKLEQSLSRLGDLSEDVRNLSHQLHPYIIEDLGLAPALRSLTENFGEREGMITSFFHDNVPADMSVQIATVLYRIAQEALRNVAKHAGKTHVKVSLAGIENGLELQVADAGKGFVMDGKRSGLGLISMEERARLIGATVKVQSAPHEGTKVTVFVNLAANATAG